MPVTDRHTSMDRAQTPQPAALDACGATALLGWCEGVLATAPPDFPGIALSRRARTHLAALRGADAPRNAPTPTTSPVLSALPELTRRGALSLDVASLLTRLHWRQNQHYVGDPQRARFLARYGYANIIGDAGLAEVDGLLVGVLLLGAETHDPAHHHPAEETYHVVAGTADWQRGQAWTARAPGAVIHHPSGVSHAMRTGPEPLLAVYCWGGATSTAARWAEGSLP